MSHVHTKYNLSQIEAQRLAVVSIICEKRKAAYLELLAGFTVYILSEQFQAKQQKT